MNSHLVHLYTETLPVSGLCSIGIGTNVHSDEVHVVSLMYISRRYHPIYNYANFKVIGSEIMDS